MNPIASHPGPQVALGRSALVLPGFASPDAEALLAALCRIMEDAPFRHMLTPGGFSMSVAATNCGQCGWITDRRGYRYSEFDPSTGRPWPPMPACFARVAREAAEAAGFVQFQPDACLVNRYVPKSRLSLHQDKDERDFSQPIVTVSLGMSAIFLFGGQERSGKTARIPLSHGDVVVWGGEDRLRYHGVLPLKDDPHPMLGSERISLTFRKAR
jgi:alkylated DNA repair protein (DNA oxidative demethylase)